ncbi:MAG TPA: DUF547 domain-containing protein [Bdellovibrionota bacterium]|jgi:hypothetical protein|nr:DUF547 domain-containing protein [Bdellovibrionota bacterium]
MRRFLVPLALCLLWVEPASATGFDQSHARWSAVLSHVVVPNGGVTRVRYGELKRDPSALNAYLTDLSAVGLPEYQSWSRDEQAAFLVNAFNAFTLKFVADHYPLKSIKDAGGLFKNAWTQPFFRLLGEPRSLDWIRHDCLRAHFHDPRFSLALTLAARGGPSLAASAYTSTDLQAQLDRAANQFLATPTGGRLDAASRRILVSPLFSWYAVDFGEGDAGLRAFLKKRISASDQDRKLLADPKIPIRYLNFDWGLDDAPGPH